MRAILMAAGVGSRISQTVQRPKSTLPIGDTTIIAHTVRMLTEAGIETAVVVGYKKQEIYQALQGLPVQYYFNPFFKVTNSMASLWFARDFLSVNEDTLLANADVFWEKELLGKLTEDPHLISMLGDQSRIHTGDYFFKTTKDHLLSQYGKDLPENERSCEYVGVAKISGSHIETFKKQLEDAVEQEVYDLWWENVLYDNSMVCPIFVKDVNGCFWGEVDVIEDYERIQEYVRKNR